MEERTAHDLRRRAMAAVLAFGAVSLLADIVYEGARSIIGPYLFTLGASASLVGLVSGAGEFAGYALRSVTGVLADRTRAYWPMTFAGYGLTVVAVPILGWVGRVDLALALVVAERLGKAVRSPARDTLLSEAAEPLGRGWGFGIHEALDQTGAVTGPLLLAAVLAVRTGDYRFAFTILAIPGVLAMIALVLARRMMRRHGHADDPTAATRASDSDAPDPRSTRYLGFVLLSAIGFAPFPLIAFHLGARAVATDAQIPLMFALAMAIDAGVALLSGHLYDRRGLAVLLVMPPLAALALLSFSTTGWVVWLGAAAWGGAMGIQESTMRAAVGDLAPAGRRATAYGIFNTAYGVGLLAGGVVLGVLYEQAIPWVVAAVIGAQTLAGAQLWRLLRVTPPART